jgi:predicted nucleic acid-binding protein
MIVVSDATPIISLLKIDQLHLLHGLFQEVFIPQAVYDELTLNPVFEKEAMQIKECSFITKVEVGEESSVNLFQRVTGLDRGESEAIIYTDSIGADLILMDEIKGRKIAVQVGLRVMGTLGILLEAYEQGLISKEEIFSGLDILKNSGRYISEALYKQLTEKIKNR